MECLLNLAFTKDEAPKIRKQKEAHNGTESSKASAQTTRHGHVPNLTSSSRDLRSARAPPPQPQRDQNVQASNSTYHRQPNQSSFPSKSGMDSILDRSLIAYSLDQSGDANDTTSHEDHRKLSFELSEQLLLRDLLYVFQGIDGRYIKFSDNTDRFELVGSGNDVPVNTRHLVSVLSEVGWLYKRTSQAISAQLDDQNIPGNTVQSFCACLQIELDDFFRLLSVLESQLNVSTICSVNSADFHSQDVSQHARLVPNSLTLRRLFTWMQAPLQRLRNLCNIAEACRGLRGGAMVSCLYDFARNGDPNVQKFVGRILRKTTYPLMGKLW